MMNTPVYENMVQERDLMVSMRDGVNLAVDIYRPIASARVPALYATSLHNKDLQRPEVADAIPRQPAHSTMWFGIIEAGDTRRFISNGYAHVIAQPRGSGKSEGEFGRGDDWDHYDLIQWIAEQPWCDGNVGMVGISGFAGEQWRAADQHPPALKAIFPYDACGAYGGPLGTRDLFPGGVQHAMFYFIDAFSCIHENRGQPRALPPPLEELWEEAMNNPDYKVYANLYNILTQKGQRSPGVFFSLINPYEEEGTVEKSEERFSKFKLPFYTGSGAYAYSYKVHWQGAQHYFQNIDAPKKFLFTGPAHLSRPFNEFHDEIIRWYDHWLKGKDNGIMREPPVKYWVMGANKWRHATDWPPAEVKWKKYYLGSWERLTEEAPPSPESTAIDVEPDAFVQMPLTKTSKVERLRYMTEPLAEDVLVVGPVSLTLYAAIDQDDTNWIIVLKDVGPDVSVQTAREGERSVPGDLREREVTRGWLKASCRELDPKRSKPGAPFHKLTRKDRKSVVPGEIVEYQIEILATANQFNRGHRICVEVTCMDVPTGIAGFSNVEYIPYHICSSRTVLHKIYHSAAYPSHLLLPILPVSESNTYN